MQAYITHVDPEILLKFQYVEELSTGPPPRAGLDVELKCEKLLEVRNGQKIFERRRFLAVPEYLNVAVSFPGDVVLPCPWTLSTSMRADHGRQTAQPFIDSSVCL